ncbi:hypothetical protein ACFOON_14885 [Novosphingobium piscinae]|uniref:Peptidoglycan endopeptidase n=1 Tax=Novosphingobium piscinae TaxID=1507448 RepID=A0A7X1G1M9_9SPHN|nr:hypothetical protein [Novosphingobium piscinae]MBC2670921.1 hypothetical protein [Novosphingobium piscinae]
MSAGLAVARAAAELVGCRFRLHGRDPASGLDCIGVVAVALLRSGRAVDLPRGYAWRGALPGAPDVWAARHGFRAADGPPTPGEVWLLRPGPGQWHLAMVDPEAKALIEAHAGLRRVVRTPLGPDPLAAPTGPLARWRLAPG